MRIGHIYLFHNNCPRVVKNIQKTKLAQATEKNNNVASHLQKYSKLLMLGHYDPSLMMSG